MDNFYKIIKKIDLKELVINLKITFICFFILRVCIISFFGLTEFFTAGFIERILIYATSFIASFVIIYLRRDFILLLLNFLVSILFGMIGPLIKVFFIYKTITNLILYPTMLIFWFIRMHPIVFMFMTFLLLVINLQFIWLVFTLLFLVYIYEIILNPFYPFKRDIYDALEFYSLEMNIAIKRLQNTILPRPFMLCIDTNKILELHKNLHIQYFYKNIIIVERKSYVFIVLNYIFEKFKFNVRLPEFQPIYFLNFTYHHEFLILYLLAARFYYFDKFFKIR